MNQPSNLPNLSPAQIDAMLKLAGNRLGMNPEDLKRQLQSGNLPQGVNTGNLSQYLNDPQKAQALLNSQAAQNLLKSLMQGGK